MPVILTKPDEFDTWLDASLNDAIALQRPLPNELLRIVAKGEKSDRALVGDWEWRGRLMALMHIPLEQVEEKHLQWLIETGTAESLWIEYKQQTYGNTDEARAEFLADISSFANSSVAIWWLALKKRAVFQLC
jgi:hypothetical protein